MSRIDYFSIPASRFFDFFVTVFAAYLAFLVRFQNLDISSSYHVVIFIGALLVFMACSSTGVYVSWRGRNRAFLFGQLAISWFLAFSVLFALLVFSKQSSYFSRSWIALWMLLGLMGGLGFRVLVYAVLGLVRSKGWNHKRVLILGGGPTARMVEQRMQHSDWIGYKVVATIPVTEGGEEGLPCFEGVSDIEGYIRDQDIKEVWICLPLSEGARIHDILHEMRHSTVDVRYAPDMSDLALLNHRVSEVAGVYTLELTCGGMDEVNLFVKKIEDIVLAMMILLAVSPLLALISIGVKLTSPGPVLFKQQRNGIDGTKIKVYKFRTMYVDSGRAAGYIEQAQKNDPRVTPFGAFLRRTSLDELPQFYNVLQGRMSVVGPRPHALSHNEHYKELISSYMQRHKVKPGITGWAQVHGLRGETDSVDKMQARVEHDLFYIENWSIWLDIKIVFLTLLKGFNSKNAY